MKECTKCKIFKPLDNFYKHKNGYLGLNSVCKICWKEQNKLFEEVSPRSKYRLERYKKIKVEYIKKELLRKKQKYHNDINYKLITNTRNRINNALKNCTKSNKTIYLLGINIQDYKLYLEKQFKPDWNWLNHGKIWEIDHIVPISNFDLTQSDQQYKAFHYTNTQPLLKEENRIKSDKLL